MLRRQALLPCLDIYSERRATRVEQARNSITQAVHMQPITFQQV